MKYPTLQKWETIITPTKDICVPNSNVILDRNLPSSEDKRLYIAKRSCTTLVALIRALYDAIAKGLIEKNSRNVVLSISDNGNMVVDGSIAWSKVESFIKLFF